MKVLNTLALLLFVSWGVAATAEHADQGGMSAAREAGNSKIEKCINRIAKACYLSKNDIERLEKNASECKHVQSASGKTELEVILLKNSDKVIVMETAGANYDRSPTVPREQVRASDAKSNISCPTVKYTVDASGIKEFKVLGNKFWMVSNDGQVYFAHSDQSFYELMNTSGNSYSGVKEVKGKNGEPDTARLIFGNGQEFEVTHDVLEARKRQGKVRQIQFVRFYTQESLFRDK